MSVKPSSTMKKFLEAGKADTRVLGKAERHILSRPLDTSRRTDVLHPSEMSKVATWCHRASYFQILGYAPPPRKTRIGLQTQMVFDEGHYIHAKWQKLFADMGILYGTWNCWVKGCTAREWGMPYPECPNGHGLMENYAEVPLSYTPLHFGGHADGWIVGCGEGMLLEIKSVGEGTFRWEAPEMLYDNDNDIKKAWKALETPFTSHIYQAQIYLKLLELIDNPDAREHPLPQQILFLYESKATQEYKEFVIPKSDFGITEIFDACQVIADCVKAKSAPACNVKGSELCSSCKGYL